MSEVPQSTTECNNNRSATLDPIVVTKAVQTEVVKGYVIGPFQRAPYPVYRINPLGVATGKYSGKKRLILDLSAPHNLEHTASINDLISKESASLSYVTIDYAISVIKQLGHGAQMCKVDITDAFKQIPLHPRYWPFFGFRWDDSFPFAVQEIPSPGAPRRPPSNALPTQLTSDVDLNRHLDTLWSAAISRQTRTAYSTGFQCYLKFMLKFSLFTTLGASSGLPPVNDAYLQYFLAHCFGFLKLSHDTVKTYLAGIRFTYLQAGIRTLFDDVSTGALNRIQTLLRGYKRAHTPERRKRLPITYHVLRNIIKRLRDGVFGPFNDLVMECMCLAAFFGFLRCGELTCSANFDPSRNITMSDISFVHHKRTCVITLKVSKTDPFRLGVRIALFATDTMTCPYSALSKLYSIRTQCRAAYQDPLFVSRDYLPISRTVFLSWLDRVLTLTGYNSADYSGHSFRIGAATTAATVHIEDHLIKTMGRWTSDCYAKYIRTSDSTLGQAHKAMCHHH
ncbi:uncharacterized protein [Haliotis cracherodii]|uniref:uncharacterized protein n=1 Tax=Haliotis cracherodii TaxID=6455 RepID=UPI0039E85796